MVARKVTLTAKEMRDLRRMAEDAVEIAKRLDRAWRYSKGLDLQAFRRIYSGGVVHLSPTRQAALMMVFGLLKVGRR